MGPRHVANVTWQWRGGWWGASGPVLPWRNSSYTMGPKTGAIKRAVAFGMRVNCGRALLINTGESRSWGGGGAEAYNFPTCLIHWLNQSSLSHAFITLIYLFKRRHRGPPLSLGDPAPPPTGRDTPTSQKRPSTYLQPSPVSERLGKRLQISFISNTAGPISAARPVSREVMRVPQRRRPH